MATNVYEGMFLLEANRYGKDPEAASQKIVQLLEEPGGEVLVSRLWEERRLAYPIKGHRRGIYWLTYFRLDGRHLDDIRRQCHQSDLILRELILKVDPRIVETLVTHARAGEVGRTAAVAAAASQSDAAGTPAAEDQRDEGSTAEAGAAPDSRTEED